MNCHEARKIHRASPASRALATAARRHLEQCATCQRRLGLDHLAASLIRIYAAPSAQESPFPSPYFFTRLRARLSAEAGLNFWESAILAARGWLLAFGAVAAILLAASLISLRAQSPQTTQLPDYSVESLFVPAARENILIANGEALSHDAVLFTLVTEDHDHARK